MAMIRVTFRLDEETVTKLGEAAEGRSIPKSQAVREAIHEYFIKSTLLPAQGANESKQLFRDIARTKKRRPR